MKEFIRRLAAIAALPEGALPVGSGLIVAGVTAYGFLAISARALGADRYASLSALWALLFVVGPGFFFPLEQEVARALAQRRSRGLGGRAVVGRAALTGGVASATLIVLIALASGPLTSALFDGQVLLLGGLALGLVGYAAAHLVRGTLSGNNRFGPYGVLIGAEGTFRVIGCVGLALLGVSSAGPFGLVLGLAPLAAIAVALRGQRDLVTPGPPAPWSELSTALGFLLVGSVLAQLLVNAPPLAVKLLASEEETSATSRVLASLVIARVPLFLFQAVQASLLPKLAGFVGAGRHADFRRGLRRLLQVVFAVGAAAVIGAWLLGPPVVRFLFGSEFVLARNDLALLAAGSAAYMAALTYAQALIALSAYSRVGLGWGIGVASFILVTAFGTTDLILRAEMGFLAGSVAAATSLAVFTIVRMRRGAPRETDAFIAAGQQ